MRKEYALSGGRPNPYAKRIGEEGRSVLLERFLRSQHFVRLDEDVAEAFKDDAAVNEALRLILRAKALPTHEVPRRTPRPSGSAPRDRGGWAMTIDEASVLAYLDAACELDWPDFRTIDALEYHALRLVVLRERGSEDWGLVFDTVRGSFLHPYEATAVGITRKIYGPSVPSHAIDVPARQPIALTTTPHEPADLELDGVRVSGPAGDLVFDPTLIAALDLRPGKVCNYDGVSESPADMLLLRAYLARFPGSLFPPVAESAAALGGGEADVLLVADAFEHVLGPHNPEDDPAIDRFVVSPSASPVYRSLARAIVARDASRFEPGASNLDWRLWARFDDANAR